MFVCLSVCSYTSYRERERERTAVEMAVIKLYSTSIFSTLKTRSDVTRLRNLLKSKGETSGKSYQSARAFQGRKSVSVCLRIMHTYIHTYAFISVLPPLLDGECKELLELESKRSGPWLIL